MDQRDKLKENPFSYQVRKNGTIAIFVDNKMIKTLGEKDANRFLRRILKADDFNVQLELARVTGHYKHV